MHPTRPGPLPEASDLASPARARSMRVQIREPGGVASGRTQEPSTEGGHSRRPLTRRHSPKGQLFPASGLEPLVLCMMPSLLRRAGTWGRIDESNRPSRCSLRGRRAGCAPARSRPSAPGCSPTGPLLERAPSEVESDHTIAAHDSKGSQRAIVLVMQRASQAGARDRVRATSARHVMGMARGLYSGSPATSSSGASASKRASAASTSAFECTPLRSVTAPPCLGANTESTESVVSTP